MSLPITTTFEPAFTSASVSAAPRLQIQVVDRRHPRRPAARHGVVAVLLVVLHPHVAQPQRSAHVLARRARLLHRQKVLVANVFALLALQVLIHVGDHVRRLGDDEDVRAKIEDLLRHIAIDAVDERFHGNHRRHRDHHPQQGQHAAQLVGPQRLQSNPDGFHVFIRISEYKRSSPPAVYQSHPPTPPSTSRPRPGARDPNPLPPPRSCMVVHLPVLRRGTPCVAGHVFLFSSHHSVTYDYGSFPRPRVSHLMKRIVTVR